MRTLVISDIHANMTALEAVIAHAGRIDATYCLGDLVGYGPDPNECVQMVRELPNLTCVMGNHDAALMGFIDMNAFNGEALGALTIQSALMTQETRDFLELLPMRVSVEDHTLAHGSPRNPIWEYILHVSTASANFPEFETARCLIGHTHIPSIFEEREAALPRLLTPSSGDVWRSRERFILNPGSVGQPRDRDCRASYVLYDSTDDTWQFRRVAYNIDSVVTRVRERGLSPRLGNRLYQGI